MAQDDGPLRILICIGGGPEAFTGLKFAARLSKQSCATIGLLYVRPLDSGLKSGGMEVRVARENILDWGLELPGMAALRKARDILLELGEISDDKRSEWRHVAISGDPSGEYILEYDNPCGATVSLRLRTAPDVTSAVADEAERFNADLVIVGGSPKPVEGLRRYLAPRALALKVAAHSPRPVIVARHLEPGHGHLVCVQETERSRAMLAKAVRYAHACNCPTTLLSVARDESELESAQRAVDEAAAYFTEHGITPRELLVETGDPAEVITEIGYDFSLIIMAESAKPWFAKAFSVAHDVAVRARNSVLIVK
jgi:nucleotide-binding universal stress UspA family protein